MWVGGKKKGEEYIVNIWGFRVGLNFCRHGCDAVEDAEHVIMHCIRARPFRERLRDVCADRGLDFELEVRNLYVVFW